MGLIAWAYAVFMVDILGEMLADPEQQQLGGYYMIAFNSVFGIAMICMIRAVFTDPGRIPDSWVVGREDTEQGHLVPYHRTHETKHDGSRRICRKSRPNVYKPDRAHFCRMLSRCVLKMDHFCPWLNNCIGFCNHKYFVLFIFYMAVETCYMVYVMTPVFIRHVSTMEEVTLDFKEEFRVSLTYLMLCLLSFGLTAFFCFHAYLVATNYTTIEFLEKRGCSPPADHVNRYDLGIWRNITAVMGDNILVWPFPTRWTCRGDGLVFEFNSAYSSGPHKKF